MMLSAFFYEIFSSLPRQGPGSSAATRKLWSMIPRIPDSPEILDIGCGSGAQTRDLARLTKGTITAIDNYRPFTDRVNAWAAKGGCADRVHALCASMDDLPFAQDSFDIIWSEGAIDIMGFEKGLSSWKHFLKAGGHMVVSAIALFTPDTPREVLSYLESFGVASLTEDALADQVRNAGLDLLATRRLEKEGWTTNYFVPLRRVTAALRPTHAANPDDAALLDSLEEEARMYDQYGDTYGYTFFLMCKP